jgi:hypothetical protein
MDDCSYAVVPDETGCPAAVFLDLDEAIDWALTRFGSDRFAIRRYQALEILSDRNDRFAKRMAKAT